jgi:hypothetical protein
VWFRAEQPEEALPDADAKEACDQFIKAVRGRANANERAARVLTVVIVAATSSIPFLIVASDRWGEFVLGKLLPALLAAIASGTATWMQFGRPTERWKLYKSYQRAAEVERLLFHNRVAPYDDENTRDKALINHLAALQLRLNDDWAGLIPRSTEVSPSTESAPLVEQRGRQK